MSDISEPIYNYYDRNKTRIRSIKYYNTNGELHRPWREGPAEIWYDDTPENRIWRASYYKNGKLYRPHKEGPALILYWYAIDNRIAREEYYKNGVLHRPHKEGPASVDYWLMSNNDMNLKIMEYYENGTEILSAYSKN